MLDVISCLFSFLLPIKRFLHNFQDGKHRLTRRLLYFLDFYSIFQKFRKIILYVQESIILSWYVIYSTLIKSTRNSKDCTCSSWSGGHLPATRNYTKYVHKLISNTALLYPAFKDNVRVLHLWKHIHRFTNTIDA